MLLTLQQQSCKQKTERAVQTGQVNLEILSNILNGKQSLR